MDKNKYMAAVGVSVLAVALLITTGAVFYKKGQATAPQSYNAEAAAGNSTDSSSSLSVQSGGTTATNLGQLGGGTGSAQGSTSSSSGASSSSDVNPSTFKEYDKYKDSTGALFGDLVKGTGAELGANQKAAVYYKGWLTDGTMFDQSRAGSDGKLQAFTFTLGAHEVISGWEQGVAGMKVGGKRLIIVPPSVGYGATGQGPIPGNAVLVFEVELLAVQ